MKKHTLIRILFVIPLLLSAVLFSAHLSNAKAQENVTCTAWPTDGQEFSLSECDSFEFAAGWIAINKGLIEEYQKGAIITVTVSGNGYSRTFSPEVVKSHWTDSFPVLPEELGVNCPSPYVWISDYFLPLGSLEAGTYTTILTIEPNHPLKDGFANVCTWSDGSPITEFPALYTEKEVYTNTFVVSP